MTKQKKNHLGWMALCILGGILLFFTACPGIIPDITLGTELSADVNSPTTLAAGNYTVTGSFYVNSILTISPGATLRFNSGKWISVATSGQIIANGTTASRITFTSSATAPAAGSWDSVGVDGAGSSFTYCDFKYAVTALVLGAKNTTVDNCSFTTNTTAVDARTVGSGSTITNNTFTSNGEPLMINSENDLGATNTFVTNTNQRIFFNGEDVAAGATRSWAETDVPTYIDGSFYVNGTLSVAAGMTLSFNSAKWLQVSTTGTMTANGTSASRITFTSSAASPAAGTWDSIGVDGAGSSFTYCDFKYAVTALALDAKNLTVDNCTFTTNTTAVDARTVGSGLTITNNTFTSNGEPLMINSENNLGATNSFVTNTNQRIFFNGEDVAQGATRSWSETDVPTYIDGSFYVSGNLSLAAGMTLKFNAAKWLQVSSTGVLNATGTSANHIIFTSAVASPAAGSWDGIGLDAAGSTFVYCDFRYATTALTANGHAVTLTSPSYTSNNVNFAP